MKKIIVRSTILLSVLVISFVNFTLHSNNIGISNLNLDKIISKAFAVCEVHMSLNHGVICSQDLYGMEDGPEVPYSDVYTANGCMCIDEGSCFTCEESSNQSSSCQICCGLHTTCG